MAGGKGGSSTTSVEVPQYIEDAAKFNLRQAGALGQPGIAQIGYVPYYGADVAAFTPTQEAAFQNVAGQAGAFGLTAPAGGAMAGMPTPQEFAGGVRGYSSAPMYEQSLGEFARRRPAQFNLIESLFINPVTGEFEGAPVVDATPPPPTTPIVEAQPPAFTVGTQLPDPVVTRPDYVGPVFDPSTDPYGPTVDVDDVLDVYEDLPSDVLPPIVPAVGGDTPAVGDIIDNELLKQQQNQVVVDAFEKFGDVLNNPNLTAEQIAAANPAFNPEIAEAARDVPVTINTPQGSYTVPAGELGSADFAAATGGTYTPPTEPFTSIEQSGNMGTFTGGGTGNDVADIMEQYGMAGASASAAGIRNIGGAYAQSPAGSGDLVETLYKSGIGSEIIGVTSTPEDTFGADLYRSLTDPAYDPEGTVLSRALDGLLTPSSESSQPDKLETLGDYVQAAPSLGMTATEAAIAFEQNKPQSKGQERSEREQAAERDRNEASAAIAIAEDPSAYKNLSGDAAKQAVRDLGLPAYDAKTSKEVLTKLSREATATAAIAENPDAFKNVRRNDAKKILKDFGMGNYDAETAAEVLKNLVRKVEA